MSKIKPLYALVFAFTLMGALPGCATYEKCAGASCTADEKITANVQARLAQHAEIGPLVWVHTQNGVVYLSGEVNEGLQRDTAKSVAGETPGVVKVVDGIAVSK